MALRVLTNEKDKNGQLIEQLIVSDQEEAYFKELAEQTFEKFIKKEYELYGLPDTVRKRQKFFGFLVALHDFWIYVVLAISGAIATSFSNIKIGF